LVPRYVTAADLQEALKALGRRVPLKEVQDMIWEVDEDLDGKVDWSEMRLMFQRNVRDRAEMRPSHQRFSTLLPRRASRRPF